MGVNPIGISSVFNVVLEGEVKVLVFSDLQADDGSNRLRSDPSIPLQRWRVNKFYNWVSTLIRKNSIDAIWDLGDTTDNRTAITHPILQSVAKGCAKITSGTRTVLNFKLIGNHEQHLKSKNTHVGDLFSPYFNVVEDRATFHLPDSLSIVCASFQYDNQELAVWLSDTIHKLKTANKRIIVLGHFTVQGSKLNSGATTTTYIPMDALTEANLVLLGHIHRRQKTINGWYIGSPFQQDFGEASDPTKAIAILDTDTLNLEWIATPFPTYRVITVDELDQVSHSEDVFRVMVRSSQEAEQLYASPHANTVEAIYAFERNDAKTESSSLVPELSFDSLIFSYTKFAPVPDGISVEELIAEAQYFRS